MRSQPDLKKRLAVAFVFFFALLQFPLISIFNHPSDRGQWPVLFVGILLIWSVLIITLYILVEGGTSKTRSKK